MVKIAPIIPLLSSLAHRPKEKGYSSTRDHPLRGDPLQRVQFIARLALIPTVLQRRNHR